MSQTSKIQMMIHNDQGAYMGTFYGETPEKLLENIRNSEYDLSDCKGLTDQYIYADDTMYANTYDRDVVAE
jgi:hypothetical protein